MNLCTYLSVMRLLKQWRSRATIKYTILLLLVIFYAHSYLQAQTITLSAKSEPLANVFKQIQKQSGYLFWYKNNTLKNAAPVTLSVKAVPLKEVLDKLFTDQPLDYEIVDKTIVVKPKQKPLIPDKKETVMPASMTITGIVTDEENQSLPNVNVMVKGTQRGAITDAQGRYQVEAGHDDVLIFSSSGYQLMEITAGGRTYITARLTRDVKSLDETVIIGYGATTRRFNTGSVARVTAEQIRQQNVGNPIKALSGLVPGMFIQSASGMAGSNVNVQIRGINSVAAGSNPLYIVDGVPFGSASQDLISIASNTNIRGGLSPFNSLNPADIESVEILKDADATAIYGSRGANGVVLITTRRGVSGKTSLDLSISQGVGQVPHFIDMLSTPQYIALRESAFAIAGITPTVANAPDLKSWDQSRDVDWQKEILGGSAAITDIQASLSGGTALTRFSLSAGYRNEGSVLPGSLVNRKIVGRLSIEHGKQNNGFYTNTSVSYSLDYNKLASDPTGYVHLPPNYPGYDSIGKPVWRPGALPEPLAMVATPFNNITHNLFANSLLQYSLGFGWKLKLNLGYTRSDLTQTQKFPLSVQRPSSATAGYSYFGDNNTGTWNIEPQVTYSRTLGPGKLDMLAGTTFQETQTRASLIYATAYANDASLDNPAAAGNLQYVNSTEIRYRYQSVFGRANYNLTNRYLLNLTFRRDASSRFGPGRQFGNFGALGAAWIFSEESFVDLPFLSFGKFRGSYGITGNDQISDYQYLSSYSNTIYTYQVPAIRVARIANPDYGWETNRKLELAMELGFWENRLQLSVAHYRNRGGNQLVSYPLATQSGFSSYQANLPATLQNTGFEFTFSSTNVSSKNLQWITTFNLTLPRNKLIAFPGIEATSYGTNNLVIGEPLSLIWGYHYLGVDQATGTARVEDLDHSGTTSSIGDFTILGTNIPRYFGGFSNTLSVGRLRLELLLQFAQKLMQKPLAAYTSAPGTINNMPAYVSDVVWRRAGDQATLPKPTISNAGFTLYSLSDAAYEDASYLKLKSLQISYSLGADWTKKAGIADLRLWLQGQNLLTFTGYSGRDPETTTATVLPNLRIISVGLQCRL